MVRPGGHRRESGRVVSIEPDRLRSQLVQRGCPDMRVSVRAQMVSAKCVGHYPYDVHLSHQRGLFVPASVSRGWIRMDSTATGVTVQNLKRRQTCWNLESRRRAAGRSPGPVRSPYQDFAAKVRSTGHAGPPLHTESQKGLELFQGQLEEVPGHQFWSVSQQKPGQLPLFTVGLLDLRECSLAQVAAIASGLRG